MRPSVAWSRTSARLPAFTLLLVMLVPGQCGGPSGKDVGGDGNPFTGECKVEFEETVGGTLHRYPEMLNEDLRLVAGKAIFTCGRPPNTHHATASLEKRRQGAGAQWVVADRQQSSRVPRPKEALFLRGTCDFGETQYWRVHVEIKGTARQADGRVEAFEVEGRKPGGPDHLPGEEMSSMRPGIDDGGVLLLANDGGSWVMLNLSGQPVYRNDALATDDAAGACDWAHHIVTALTDAPPHRPGNTITGVRCYTFHECDGVVQAELSAGRTHHDGQGWVRVDGRGEVTHRNDDIGRDDADAALDWANKITAPGLVPVRRSRWRASIGRFPDGTYYDADGRLGRQRLRRAWNRMLTWAGAP
ncbi:MAG TPA: hypothetical protein VFB74_16355 [Kribbellaceae bacterium]|nr:hypothetical protein [Kribbellaceae bacterium]